MDMELQHLPLEGYQPVYHTMLRQEETLESIVSDTLPDITHIVECRGAALLRQKEALDGGVRVSGTVQASVICLPEGSDELCAMAMNIPFVCTGSHPAIKPDCRTVVEVKVLSADARLLNPRKVLARVEIGVCVTAYGEEKGQLCAKAVCPADTGLQSLWETHTAYAVVHSSEKHISFTESLHLSSVRPAIRKLLSCSGEIAEAEGKVIGKKAVVKGNVAVTALCLSEGGVTAHRFLLPFSQVMETGGVFEECETEAIAMLTGFHCQQESDGGWSVNVEALLQILVRQEREVGTVADLYSVSRVWDVRKTRLSLRQLQGTGTVRQSVRQLCPVSTPAMQLVECDLRVGECATVANGEEAMLATAKVYASLLWLGEDGGLNSASYVISAAGELPWAADADCECRCTVQEPPTAVVVSGGIEVRFDAEFHYRMTRTKEIETVSSVLPGKAELPMGRPSLRIRAAGEGERLWDIAKCCGSTVADILEVNDLQTEDVVSGKLLLIPKSR